MLCLAGGARVGDEIVGFTLMSEGTRESHVRLTHGAIDWCVLEAHHRCWHDTCTARQEVEVHKQRLRRLLDVNIHNTTKDHCSFGILGPPLSEASIAVVAD